MGVFSVWQPRYLERGIATFPTIDKRPAIGGWQNVGAKGSTQLAFKFNDAEEIAFVAGPRSGLTIVDVDTTDEDAWRDAEKRFGPTPIMVRTGSGHVQFWYRYNGEGRKIRTETFVDVLGGGQVLGFPSKRGQGYTALRRGLEALPDLPVACNIEARPAPQFIETDPERLHRLIKSGRNDALFDYLMRNVRRVDDFVTLLDVAHTWADQHLDRTAGHPLTDAEVIKTAQSVWGYESRGQNRFGAASTLNITRDKVRAHAAANPDAFALLCILQTEHKGVRDSFFLAKALAPALGWTVKRFQAARDYLVTAKELVCLHPGGKGPKDPPVYRFAYPSGLTALPR